MMFTSITKAVVVPLIVNRFAEDALIDEGIGADDGVWVGAEDGTEDGAVVGVWVGPREGAVLGS